MTGDGRAALGLLLLVAMVAAVLGATPIVGPTTSARAQDAGGADASTCQRLTDGRLVAQLIGAPVRDPHITSELRAMVADHAGTAVLFGAAIQDAPQLVGLIADLDAAAPEGLPPLIAVDEEGGRVARLGRGGITAHLPSARQQAASGSPDQVRQAAADLAGQMSALGVDLDLAPVLDLSDDPATSIIGDRSFSADPAVAGAYGLAFAAGLHEGGIATTAKHFPDHGLTTTDTHTATATVEVSLEALREVHLAPYRQALPHTDAIMLSHLRIDALDPGRPVSLSPAAVAFLRQELGAARSDGRTRAWDGVVMTDDLSMQAVAAVADQPTAAVMAVAAGVDLVLVGSTGDAEGVHAALARALEDGRLSRSRVVDAARRVLSLQLSPEAVRCRTGPTHYGRR